MPISYSRKHKSISKLQKSWKSKQLTRLPKGESGIEREDISSFAKKEKRKISDHIANRKPFSRGQ